MEGIDLQKSCEEVVTSYPPELLRRALSYLYNKETKSSFEIEHIKPSALSDGEIHRLAGNGRAQGLLREASPDRRAEPASSIPRFRETDYRANQNFVGQTISYQKQLVHYVCPKSDDLPELMAGLLAAHQVMKEGAVPAIIHAAAISYGFVFMHPFEGRQRTYSPVSHSQYPVPARRRSRKGSCSRFPPPC